MPIYEEKLISPHAIRFTQQRIRETFRDSKDVEATIQQIKVRPGKGDYDLILNAPFPTIEIVRWASQGRSRGGKEHWFSFDNRRLYCLQRVAAAYWPKRVAATVEVLYADDGTIRKKLDSQTEGMSVSIGHAFATPDELKEWSWRNAVKKVELPDESLAERVEASILADDAKASVRDLTDAPGEMSAFERLSMHLAQQTAEPSSECKVEPCVTPEGQDAEIPESTAPLADDADLAALMKQLTIMMPKQPSESKENVVDGTSTTASPSVSANSESLASDAASNESEHSQQGSTSDEENKAAQASEELPAPKAKVKGKKAARDFLLAQHARAQAAAAWQFQAAQHHVAQQQMAQWQMAQMAHWQAMQYHGAWP